MAVKTSRIDRGDIARDRVTGYQGVVMARTVWLNGCVRLILQAQKLKDDVPHEGQTFDIQQVELVKKGAVTAAVDPDNEDDIIEAKPARRSTGGPAPSAMRHPSARREGAVRA